MTADPNGDFTVYNKALARLIARCARDIIVLKINPCCYSPVGTWPCLRALYVQVKPEDIASLENALQACPTLEKICIQHIAESLNLPVRARRIAMLTLLE